MEKGIAISVVEPNLTNYKNLTFVDLIEGIEKADLIVVLVKHSQFCDPLVIKKLRMKQVIDFCGLKSSH